MVRGKKTVSSKKKIMSSKKLSTCCEFIKKNWHIITGVIVILAILIVIIVCVSRPRHQEMFSDDDDASPTMVMFHVPWCGHCKKAKPMWGELQSAGVLNSKDHKVKILDINCEEDKDMAKKHGVDGFPTIKYFPNGINNSSSSIVYENARDLQSLKTFINNQ